MEVQLEINDQVGSSLTADFLQAVACLTLEKVSADCLAEKKLELSCALVSEAEIALPNATYRQKAEATDVLSFAEFANLAEICAQKSQEIFLGEIILCPTWLEFSAKEQDTTFAFEAAYIFTHGILHLLGFEHGEDMFALQSAVAEEIVKKYQINNSHERRAQTFSS